MAYSVTSVTIRICVLVLGSHLKFFIFDWFLSMPISSINCYHLQLPFPVCGRFALLIRSQCGSLDPTIKSRLAVAKQVKSYITTNYFSKTVTTIRYCTVVHRHDLKLHLIRRRFPGAGRVLIARYRAEKVSVRVLFICYRSQLVEMPSWKTSSSQIDAVLFFLTYPHQWGDPIETKTNDGSWTDVALVSSVVSLVAQ